MMRVNRGIDYGSFSDKFRYRATIRVYYRVTRTTVKDIAILRVHADSTEALEKRIESIRKRFVKLVKEQPDFIAKMEKAEVFSIGEEE